MSDHPQNPTVLVGLGAFGREVIARTTDRGPDGPEHVANLAVVYAKLAEIPAVAGEVKDRLGEMLDLRHFVESTDPRDARGPRCDVLLVGDLGEPEVLAAAPALVAAIEDEVGRAFEGILRSGDGALLVCPLLRAPRGCDRQKLRAAARELSKIAGGGPTEQPRARVYLVEDQSGKYLLSQGEAARSFAAFLHLVLFSRLRDEAAGLRRLVEREGDRGGPFATFACATLECDHASLASICAIDLARDLLGEFRAGGDPSIAEIATEAASLVPERQRVEEELWRESSVGSLMGHLEPPAVHVPTIDEEDTPETIVETKFGPLWRAGVARAIAAYRDDVERFKMDRLATEIERNGHACRARVEAAVGERVEALVASGPRGHARALELLRDARTRAQGISTEVEAEIQSPDLKPFPESPLDGAVAAVTEATFARPRPYRMRAFGTLAAVLGTLLAAGIVVAAYRFAIAPDPDFLDLRGPGAFIAGLTGATPDPEGVFRAFAWGPLPYLWAAAFIVGSTWYRLYKHRKRHHNWVVEARDALDQALKRHVERSIVSYFAERLHYTRLLWVQRIYRRLGERLDEAIGILEAARSALAGAAEKLDQDERGLRDRLEAREDDGILFQGLLSPEDADAVYADVRPRELAPVAERYLRESLAEAPWREAPFADPARVIGFCRAELGASLSTSPFEDDGSALSRAAADATRSFFRSLALKLSPPLRIVETVAHHGRRATWTAVVPPQAKALAEGTLSEENLRGAWDVRALSGDARRIHLLIDRGELPLEALAFAVEGAPSKVTS